ncbi:MAG: hypothetical protein GEU88_00140 [Solirubrobacterales bacterium]|nr:hypothetical protein [Solirubrobacterales bacterium]
MRSNFESDLRIVDGAIKARGELNWEAGETEALVSVSISQKGERVAGMATSPDEFKRPATNWTLDIEPGYARRFRPGPANAVGIVCAMGDDVRVFFWSQEIKLK